MKADRLLENFQQFDVEHIERVFGTEVNLKSPDPNIRRAPVKRVALISEAFLPKVDGVSKTAYLTLRYLRQTGREVLVFAPDISPDSLDGTPIVPLPSVQFPKVPETRMALPNPVIARQLQNFQPDLIHMFSPALMSVSGMATGRHMNVPIVANYQTDLPGYASLYGWDFAVTITRNWLRYIHNGCHVTLVPSNHTRTELAEQGFKRLRIWGRGVNSVRFHPKHGNSQWRAKLLNGRDPQRLLCIYVGRVATEKSIDLLIDVAKTPGVALTIIGDGAQRGDLEEFFTDTDTHFTGYLLGDALPAAFASADIFLFTGPRETFGQVVQESMASGLPSIVSNEGGVADLVIEGETGYTCEQKPEAYAQAVVKLRDNPQLRQTMAQRARELAEERPWENVLAQLEAHYAEAVAINDRFVRVFGHTNYHNISRLPIELVG